MRGRLEYVQRVSRIGFLARRYGFDALIVIAAVQSAVEVGFTDDSVNGPTTTPWFAVPAAALVVLPLLWRRRFPFAAPASVWILASAVSFVDGRLITSAVSISAAGWAAAFLLGNVDDAVQARLGLIAVVSGAAIVIYNDPSHSAGELVFMPLLFTLGWLAGFALRERAEQAEAA